MAAENYPGSNKSVSRKPVCCPKVSIVLPSYNAMRFLPKAIQSVLNQTFKDFELIVVNDGSTDKTSDFLDTLEDSRITVINQQNKRLPEALNTGFEAARGDLLTWISADNYCAPFFVEALVGALEYHQEASFAYSAFAWIDEQDRILKVIRNQNLGYSELLKANPGLAAFMYRRECAEKIGHYNPELEGAEDWDMWLRIIEKYKTVYVPEILYYYRLHNKSMTALMPEKIRTACQKTFENALSRNNNELTFLTIYPEISECSDGKTAELHAAFDLAVKFMQSPFDFQLPYAAGILENIGPKLQSPYMVMHNLAMVYARLGKWDSVLKLIGDIRQGRHPLKTKLLQGLLDAKNSGDIRKLKSIPVLNVDKKSSELFLIEGKKRLTFSWTQKNTKNIDSSNERTVVMKKNGDNRENKKQLQITYLINTIQGITGGNQTLLKQVNALVERGHAVTIVTYTDAPIWFEVRGNLIKVPVGQKMAPYVPQSDVVISTYFANTPELSNIEAPVKIYYAQGDQYIFQDKMTAADPRVEERRQRAREMSKTSYLNQDVYFVPNSHNLADTVEKAYGVKADYILPVCTDNTIFKPLERPITGSRWRLLIVGPDTHGSTFEPLAFKGISEIRKALEILSNRGGDFTAVRMSNTPPEIFRNFPCEYYFAPSDEVKTCLYGTAHILIYASHYDSCPRPPQEAMASGAAVVCTATPGAMEYCRHEQNSLLVPIKSPNEIADAVEKLMKDHELRKRIVQGGFETASQYPVKREFDELEKLLYRLVDGPLKTSASETPCCKNSTADVYPQIQNLLNNGSTEEAINLLKTLLESNPENVVAHNDLGMLYYKAGKKEDALNHYRCAAELEPKNKTFQRNLADFLFVEMGQVENALAIYLQLFEADRGDIEILAIIGHICVSLKKFEDAVEFYKRVIHIEPENSEIRENLEKLQKYLSEKNISMSPQKWYDTIFEKTDGSSPDEMILKLSALTETHPEFALAKNDLGVLYFQTDQKEKALENFRQAADLQPENITFQKNLADFMSMENGHITEALQIYIKLLENNPEDVETLKVLGDICLSMENYDDADVFFNKIIGLEPWNSEIKSKMEQIVQKRG